MDHEAPYVQKRQQEDQVQSWSTKLVLSCCSDIQLVKDQFPPRKEIIGDWFFRGDLGFVFAPRGLGKSWFGIDMAKAIAIGRPFGKWPVHGIHRVLYMDGEMPPGTIQQRSSSLGVPSTELLWLNHQIVFDRTMGIINLANLELQNALLEFCLIKGVEVLFLDNLSTLVSGIKENAGEDWDVLQGWLLQLRRANISVVWIHHSGRNRNIMRGHSKREDPAFWIIRLDPSENEEFYAGAKFISHFLKSRNSTAYPPSYEWCYEPNGVATKLSIQLADNYHLFLRLVELGIDSANQLADELGVSAPTVCRLAKRAAEEGVIIIKGRKYINKTVF